MSRPRNVTLESFDPQILDLLMQATSQPIRLAVPVGTNPFKHIARFRHFASRMREEAHPLASQVARIEVCWDKEASAIVLRSRDEGLRALKVTRADGTELTPYAETVLPGPDPLEAIPLKPRDPYAYTFATQQTQTAFDNPADKAPNEEPDDDA